ncbi:unnamed protein product [Mytilus coruscus]|uniref:Uncharacterized protein n=1 Tax=Mytilus coruscus TaxID=42192 RepID=A0A6J8AIN9_MYTCO|nr:unnamed protein product [Mytilus coruscus]
MSAFIETTPMLKNIIHKAKKIQINRIIEQNDIHTNEETIESLYESIDESAICDDNIQITNAQESLEEDNTLQSDSEVSSKSSGYLHPYTPFIGKIKTHCTQINSTHSSTVSSQSGDNKRDSGYAHPYQQLQQDLEDLRNTPKSDYTELTVIHYSELVDFPIKKETVRQNSFLFCTNTNQNVCESESHKYADGSRSYLYLNRNSQLAKFFSVQQLQSTSQIRCHYMASNNMTESVKRCSI